MKYISSKQQRVVEMLSDDPLFHVILDTPTEQLFLSEPYLEHLVEKKYYSTTEISLWFGVTDAQLRYYIKPFEAYIFSGSEDNPTSSSSLRLNFIAILRLRLILLLKDEYRVKGLKKLLHIDGEGFPIKQVLPTPVQNDLTKQVDVLSEVVQQMLQTGLFQMASHDEESIQITVNQSLLQQPTPLIAAEPDQQLTDIQNKLEKINEENNSLQKQMNEFKESYVQDVAIKMRERHIENEVIATLRTEATAKFYETKKPGFFKKLFKTSAIEAEKEAYINAFVQLHLVSRLKDALNAYHDHN